MAKSAAQHLFGPVLVLRFNQIKILTSRVYHDLLHEIHHRVGEAGSGGEGAGKGRGGQQQQQQRRHAGDATSHMLRGRDSPGNCRHTVTQRRQPDTKTTTLQVEFFWKPDLYALLKV